MGVETPDFSQTAFDMWSFGSIMSALLSGTHLFCVSLEESKPPGVVVDIMVFAETH